MGGSASTLVRRAVIDGLRAHFAATPGFNEAATENELAVTYAYDPGITAAQRLYLGRARAVTPPAALRAGRNHRQETGRFDLNILLRMPGTTVEDAEQRAHDIAVEVETWIADRKQGDGLGVTGLYELYVESWASDYRNGDRSSEAVRTITVLWRARLT